MNNKQILGDLALDLKRVAIGYFRGSTLMVDRFFQEALKRRSEINRKNLKPYLIKLLYNMENIKKENSISAADDALLYSIIFQDASTVIS